MKTILKRNLKVLSRLDWAFKDSIEHINEIDIESINTFREYEPIDAFFDRFERIIDNLFQATFRTLYEIENRQKPISLMDLSIFIVRIWIIDDVEKLIQLKDLRNKIAHEYVGLWIWNTKNFVDEVLSYKNILFKILQNVQNYSQKYLKD